MKLCLFIDGLDECDEPGEDVAKLFGTASASPYVKVCASSRPEIAYEDAFCSRPGLRLQDLTKADIENYVNDRLVKHEKMQELMVKDTAGTSELVNEIGNSANGVFLWVELVVTDLLNGLRDRNDIEYLQKRLRRLPKTLEKLYEHMVLKVDEIYEKEASQLFQLVDVCAPRDDDWQESMLPSVLELSFSMEEDPRLAETAQTYFISKDEVFARCGKMDDCLRSRCGGLLEIQRSPSLSLSTIYPNMTVGYLHRTVRDFLVTRETRLILSDRTGETFKPYIQILRSCVLQLQIAKQLKSDEYSSNSSIFSESMVRDLINRALTFARRLEIDTKTTQVALLDNLTETIHDLMGDGWVIFLSDDYGMRPKSMLRAAIHCNLHQYVRTIISTWENRVKSATILLHCALTPTLESVRFLSPVMICMLLASGADPNGKYDHKTPTPFKQALYYLFHEFDKVQLSRADRQSLLVMWSNILKKLLEFGADGSTRCEGPMRYRTIPGKARRVEDGNLWRARDVVAKVFEQQPTLVRELQLSIDIDQSKDKIICCFQ
jgi:hypothetical protein